MVLLDGSTCGFAKHKSMTRDVHSKETAVNGAQGHQMGYDPRTG